MKKNKDDIVKFRCSIEEKKLLQELAKSHGKTLSEYIRDVVFVTGCKNK